MRNCLQRVKLQKRVLKSLLRTRACPLKVKILISHKRHSTPNAGKISKQNTRCAHNGRPRGVFTWVGLSRHTLKRWAGEGRVQNLRSAS